MLENLHIVVADDGDADGNGASLTWLLVLAADMQGAITEYWQGLDVDVIDERPSTDAIGNSLFRGEQAQAIEVACWAHTRAQAGDHRAAVALDEIAKLYEVERKATDLELGPEARAKLRQAESEPILNDLMRWVVDTYNEEPPKSSLRRGLTYQSIRSIASIPRRRPAAAGQQRLRARASSRYGGPKELSLCGQRRCRPTLFYTLLGTCKHAGVEPWAYLRDVMQRIAEGWRRSAGSTNCCRRTGRPQPDELSARGRSGALVHAWYEDLAVTQARTCLLKGRTLGRVAVVRRGLHERVKSPVVLLAVRLLAIVTYFGRGGIQLLDTYTFLVARAEQQASCRDCHQKDLPHDRTSDSNSATRLSTIRQ